MDINWLTDRIAVGGPFPAAGEAVFEGRGNPGVQFWTNDVCLNCT